MIVAKTTGLMVGAKLLEETADRWRVHCRDEARPKWIDKDDERTQVFPGVPEAEAWMDAMLKEREK